MKATDSVLQMQRKKISVFVFLKTEAGYMNISRVPELGVQVYAAGTCRHRARWEQS